MRSDQHEPEGPTAPAVIMLPAQQYDPASSTRSDQHLRHGERGCTLRTWRRAVNQLYTGLNLPRTGPGFRMRVPAFRAKIKDGEFPSA